MKTILVPVDLSAATTKVCAAACELAKLMNARLVLLHVTQPPPVMLADYYAFDSGVMAEAFAAGEKFAERRLKALARLCTRQQLEVETIQVTGQPVTVILARAAALKDSFSGSISRFVPSVTVTGRSVFGRTVRHGTPR